MSNYFLQVNLYLLFSYGIYVLLLRKETFFKSNRAYLLCVVFTSLFIPLIPSPDFIQQAPIVENLKVLSEPVLSFTPIKIETQVIDNQNTTTSIMVWAWIIYLAIAIILALQFIFSLWKMLKFTLHYGIQKNRNCYWVLMKDQTQVFSFFNLIFWGANSELSSEEQSQILQHELAHVRQWHSLDIILLKCLQIIFWFNPVCYLLLGSMRQVHEYLADKAVLQQGINQQDYATLLVQQSLLTTNISLSNPFFNQNLLKSRIKMMNQNPSQASARLKFVLILPILLICFLFAACSKKTIQELIPNFQSDLAIPDGFQADKSYRINTVTEKEYIIFSGKGATFAFSIKPHQEESFSLRDITIQIYQISEDKHSKRLVANNVGQDDKHQNNIIYELKEAAMHKIVVKNKSRNNDFTFIQSHKTLDNIPVSPTQSSFKEVQKQYAKPYAAQAVQLNPQGSTKIKLGIKGTYNCFLNSPIKEGKVKITVIDENGEGTYAYSWSEIDYIMFALFSSKSDECEIRLESDVPLENNELLLFHL